MKEIRDQSLRRCWIVKRKRLTLEARALKDDALVVLVLVRQAEEA